MKSNKKFEKSSGNVFKDLLVPDAEKEFLKAQISVTIFKILAEHYKVKTQNEIAELLEIEQSEVSRLKNGKFSRFSIERLFEFLNMLNYNVDISISKATNRHVPHQLVHKAAYKNHDAVRQQRI